MLQFFGGYYIFSLHNISKTKTTILKITTSDVPLLK